MNDSLPKRVTDKMMENDLFSQWLGLSRIQDSEGESVIRITVRKEMLNGFNILHGGVSFALADSALAFAANSYGVQCVSIENSIHYHRPAKVGDVLTAYSKEVSKSKKVAVYEVTIWNQNEEKIASLKGTVYRTNNEWEV